MNLILAPGMLEPAEAFVLLDVGRPIEHARELIERFSPMGRFSGYRSDPEDLRRGERAILASHDWASCMFPADGDRFRDVDVLLAPEEYPWGYSVFARSLEGWPDARGKSRVEREEARAHLTSYGKAAVVAESVVPTDKDALAFLQDQALRSRPEVEFVMSQLADEESRKCYAGLLFGSMDGLFERYCAHVFRTVQYFECLHWTPGMVILNGGVQEGFEIAYYVALSGGDATIVCIDPAGLSKLSDFAKATVKSVPRAIVDYPYALWSESGSQSLPIANNGAVLSQYKDRNIHGLRELTFECRSIDDTVAELHLDRVDLIKLDVEGAEPAVLRAMSRVMSSFRPQLAVSIYHWPEHMWELPKHLMSSLVGYDYYIRHYSYGRWECVLYAIPSELRDA